MIPAPKDVQTSEITFPVLAKLHFSCSENLSDKVYEHITEELGSQYQKLFGAFDEMESGTINITIILDRSPKGSKPGEYHIIVLPEEITLIASSEEGLLYGTQTLRQLFRDAAHQTGEFACQTIRDWPSYPWRGLHLDISRHFFDYKFVRRYLDWMAHLKLNKFHWHISDDQGWRIESKRFPRLHEIGSRRREPDGSEYGGYYTQKQIKMVLEYAALRGIEVIPEIDIPGHAMAILAAYPDLACFPQEFETLNVWGISQDILCAGKDEVLDFLKELFTEIAELFPGQYIHLGGDEAPKDRWKDCPHCQKRIRDKQLNNEEEVQGWLVKTLAKHLRELGKTVIGWDEILDCGIDSKPVAMVWRGDGTLAARMAHDNGNRYILCPYTKLYFDARNNEDETVGTQNIITWPEVLDFRFADYQFARPKLLLGAQANVWTEHLTNTTDLKEKVVCRIYPLAERLWNGDSDIDPDEFWKTMRDFGWTP